MNILNFKLLNLIQNFKSIALTDIKKIKKKKSSNSYIILINLFFNSQIDITDYFKLKQYVQEISNQYFSLNLYNINEQAWLIFYTILKIQKGSFININNIIKDYKTLPQLNTNNEFMKWIVLQVKIDILSYYVYNNNEEKIYQLIDEINSFPDEIKSYNP